MHEFGRLHRLVDGIDWSREKAFMGGQFLESLVSIDRSTANPGQHYANVSPYKETQG